MRTYAAETATTNVRAICSGRDPRGRACTSSVPRRRSVDAADAEEVAKAILPLCLPSFTESGKLYDYRDRKLKSFQPPT